MTILDIKDITTEDSYIYYRKSYKGIVVLKITSNTEELPIKFLIETTPIGTKNVEVNLPKDIHYPILPIVKELKKMILTKSDEGLLPC